MRKFPKEIQVSIYFWDFSVAPVNPNCRWVPNPSLRAPHSRSICCWESVTRSVQKRGWDNFCSSKEISTNSDQLACNLNLPMKHAVGGGRDHDAATADPVRPSASQLRRPRARSHPPQSAAATAPAVEQLCGHSSWELSSPVEEQSRAYSPL